MYIVETGLSASDKLNTVRDWIRQQSLDITYPKDEEKPSAALFASLPEIGLCHVRYM